MKVDLKNNSEAATNTLLTEKSVGTLLLDADLKFKEYDSPDGKIEFQLSALNNNEYKRWEIVLNELENFLKGISFYYKNIRNIYLQRANDIVAKYVNNRFQYRCFQGRYIDFDSDWGSGSLLRDVPPHDNHFHLSFHDTLPNGYPRETDLSTNELTQIDLDDFIFELNEYATSLTITPQLPSTFSDKYKVFWRLQDQIGFADPKLVVSYGKWPFQKDLGNSLDKKVVFNKDSSQRYIFIAIARENGKILTEAEGFPDENGVKKYINGACVQRSITIDVSKNKVRWTYVRNGKSFSKVEL